MLKNMSLLQFLLLGVIAVGNQHCDRDTVVPAPPVSTRTVYTPDQFVMGVDLSYVNQLEDNGVQYRDSNRVKDPFVILRDRGANAVRVRLWHNPVWYTNLNDAGRLYSDLPDVIQTIQRAKNSGMAVCLDLHYSDEWADPSKQKTPKAWENANYNALKDSIYNYTLAVLNQLKARNLTPEMVQIGNETNPGMCHPLGKIDNNDFQAFGGLLKVGIRAVRDFSVNSNIKPQIILHVAQFQHAEWWANGVVNQAGVTDFDILGISHYYQWATVNTMTGIGASVRSLKQQFGKKIMVVELAYSWTNTNGDDYGNIMSDPNAVPDYPLTPQGQLKYLTDFTQTLIENGGTGVMYWEPAWIPSPMRDLWGRGSSWDNNTLFNFTGNALMGCDFMTHKYQF
jgi:arabinogalactan endo-1,4-beta-galactosidase